MNSNVIILTTCSVILLGIGVLITPHLLCIVSPEHSLYLASRTPSKALVKLRQVTASDIVREVRNCMKDTVVVHLWNSWHEQGTRFFDTLARYTAEHRHTAVLHICTDMTGIRQLRASALIAEKNGVRGISYALRSKASVFDLHNTNAISSCIAALTGRQDTVRSPSLLFLNRQGALLSARGS